MNYWILKTEPSTYSFDDLMRDKKTCWDGVRNFLARKNLRSMNANDKAVIYHSGEEKAAVGLAEISKPAYQDPKTDEDWSAVDLSVGKKLMRPVTLAEMKKDKVLKNMILLRQSRLSVCPLSQGEYERIVQLSEKVLK